MVEEIKLTSDLPIVVVTKNNISTVVGLVSDALVRPLIPRPRINLIRKVTVPLGASE